MLKTQIRLRMEHAAEKSMQALTDIDFQIFDRPELRAVYKPMVEEIKKLLQKLKDQIINDKNLNE